MDLTVCQKCSSVQPAACVGHLGFIKSVQSEEEEEDCQWRAESEEPASTLPGPVYFYLKSNLPALINDSDEGSDRAPWDGEMKKSERYQVYLGLRREGLSASPGWGGKGGGQGFLCAPFRAEVLTEEPWPPLSRNSLTLSLGAQRAHMLRSGTAGASEGWSGCLLFTPPLLCLVSVSVIYHRV